MAKSRRTPAPEYAGSGRPPGGGRLGGGAGGQAARTPECERGEAEACVSGLHQEMSLSLPAGPSLPSAVSLGLWGHAAPLLDGPKAGRRVRGCYRETEMATVRGHPCDVQPGRRDRESDAIQMELLKRGKGCSPVIKPLINRVPFPLASRLLISLQDHSCVPGWRGRGRMGISPLPTSGLVASSPLPSLCHTEPGRTLCPPESGSFLDPLFVLLFHRG